MSELFRGDLALCIADGDALGVGDTCKEVFGFGIVDDSVEQAVNDEHGDR